MGSEGRGGVNMHSMGFFSRRKRSMSFSDKRHLEEDNLDNSLEASHSLKSDRGHLKECVETKKKQLPNAEVQNSLRQEILQLEKRLQHQVSVCCALEQALGYRSSSFNITSENSIPKSATELIKEIAVLELEVSHLEQYLLLLYRKAFDQQLPSSSPCTKYETGHSRLTTPRLRHLEICRPDISLRRENPSVQTDSHSPANPSKELTNFQEEEKLDSGVHRCRSSLFQCSAPSTRTYPPTGPWGKDVRACHSQPLSMMEYSESASNIISLAEHLGTRISDHIPETPNKLSEDMIKCVSAIYFKLAEPPLKSRSLSSPTSSLSSINAFSPKDQYDMWSPGLRKESSFDMRLDNPFHVEGFKEFSGPYSTMVEVQHLYRDSQKLGDIEQMLQNLGLVISQLEEVDPRKMKHEEKLAFWINIHNALIMHAFLAYGIPQNNMKRVFQLLKAAYNVGGHIVSADVIQSCILGCRMSHPGKWLRLLLSRAQFKAGDERQAYAIEHPEPLLHFALCSGSHSDPAVRCYTPKRVFQELEAAKEEYIRATFGVRKDHKMLLPKTVESFAKNSALCPAGVVEMIQQSLPEALKKSIKKCQLGKSRKCIEWIPHNFAFRYLISKELIKC